MKFLFHFTKTARCFTTNLTQSEFIMKKVEFHDVTNCRIQQRIPENPVFYLAGSINVFTPLIFSFRISANT